MAAKIRFIRKMGRVIPIKIAPGTGAAAAGSAVGLSQYAGLKSKQPKKYKKSFRASDITIGASLAGLGGLAGFGAFKAAKGIARTVDMASDFMKIRKISKSFNKMPKKGRTKNKAYEFLQSKGFSSLNFKKPKGPIQ